MLTVLLGLSATAAVSGAGTADSTMATSLPPRRSTTTPLSIMMFYGFNETAQCGWTTHAWQELGSDQAFKKNLSVALAESVSFRAHCHAGGFVMVPPKVWERGASVTSALGSLPTDWRLQLHAFEETIAPLVRNGTVVGIFIGDEKLCGGVPLSNYTAVLAHLRAAFGRSVLLYGNECTHPSGLVVPAELDLYSFDVYNAQNDNGTSEVAMARSVAEKTIFPLLAPHQKLLLVPGVYGNTPTTCVKAGGSEAACSLDAQATQVVAKLEGFFAWAKSEERIAGFNSWHFGRRRTAQHGGAADMELGAVEMPTVLVKLRQIGEHIVARSGAPAAGVLPP